MDHKVVELGEDQEESTIDEMNTEEMISIDGIQIRTDKVKGISQKVKLVRYTTYLEEPVLDVLKILKRNNQICISTIVNVAIKEYLKSNYN
ncbi:hypothetical protein [Cellulosilyticum ruminicola]|uniref:hypothetical protein n=1 Tax=Cellulosilyticum ruminicola TaxID=425254 RepID=UPI0006D19C05|nr:hypothetical protein [Cellulosilyticum ruminicola]